MPEKIVALNEEVIKGQLKEYSSWGNITGWVSAIYFSSISDENGKTGPSV